MSRVDKLLQLVFVMPSTNGITSEVSSSYVFSSLNYSVVLKAINNNNNNNATSERSLSVLRHRKSYLRTTMSQEQLNFLMLLCVHKDRMDALNLNVVFDNFVDGLEHRLGIFAKY